MRYLVQLYDLVGKVIEVPGYVAADSLSAMVYRKVKWKVIAAYPHHVLAERTCENGVKIRECFDLGTLVQKGVVK